MMGSEGDEYLPPSGTVAVRCIPDKPHLNIVKGRFCGKGGKGELLGIRRKCHFEFVIIKCDFTLFCIIQIEYIVQLMMRHKNLQMEVSQILV